MSILTIEEHPQDASLGLTLNGLPMPSVTTSRPGDRIRAGDVILCFEPHALELSSPSGDMRLAERDDAYDTGAPPSSPPLCEATDARRALARSPELIAEAPSMRRVLERVRRVACGTSSVLLLGESGTGKEVIAQAIRANGPRASGPIVAINAAALPDSVLESELFGHERGAFTGAIARRRGLFEVASGGTLFLDEVGELPATTQAKLLRVLESKEVRRIGGDSPIAIDVRLIAATNRDLRSEVRAGRFRVDLFFRLAVVELEIPPLRDRPEDIEPLARALLADLRRTASGNARQLGTDALSVLRRYPFPGNVRELRNILEYAVNFCQASVIEASDLPPHVRAVDRGPAVDCFPTLQDVERRHVEAALIRAQWNKTRAAALLGIDRKTLYHKIAVHGITSPSLVVGEARGSSSIACTGPESPTSGDTS